MDQSVEAQLADLSEATVELETVWREILSPGRAAEPDERLVHRHEMVFRQLVDADRKLRRVTGVSGGEDKFAVNENDQDAGQ